MHVQFQSPYTSFLGPHKAYTAKRADDAMTANTENASTSAKNSTSSVDTVTGGAKNSLSAETARQLMEEAQKSLDTGTSTGARSPEEIANGYFRQIATDPNFAAKEAKIIGNSQDALLIPNDVFRAYMAAGRDSELGHEIGDPNNPVLKVLNRRKALYEQELAKGTPAAKIIEKIYEFNTNLPLSYSGQLDRTGSYPKNYYHDTQMNQLARIRQAMAEVPANLPETVG